MLKSIIKFIGDTVITLVTSVIGALAGTAVIERTCGVKLRLALMAIYAIIGITSIKLIEDFDYEVDKYFYEKKEES